MTRRWAVALGAAVVLAGGASAFWLTRDGGGAAKAATSYRLVTATIGNIRQSVPATGTIEPAVQDALNFQVSGQVTAVRVAQGQKVAKGAVLATVDSASLQASLAQAQAALASSQSRLTTDTGASASSTQLAADSAAVTAAQGQVASAQTALANATLTSPIDGVVAGVNLTVGQQVAGGSNAGASAGSGSGGGSGGSGGSGSGQGASSSTTGASSAQVLVISTDSWVVDASVDSSGVGLLATGNQAQIVPGSGSGTVYGTVASIGLIASNSSGVATYPVVVDVTGNPSGLHAGDTATVSLIYKQTSNVLTVPTAAVHVVNGKPVVYQMVNGKRVSKPVTVGTASGGQTQITSGLAEGDQVVLDVAARAPGTATRTGSNQQRGGFPGGGFSGGSFPGRGGGFSGGGGSRGGN